jgi:DNA polymerase
MTDLHIDFETRSPVDLKTEGVYRYMEHPETAPLMASYRFDAGPVLRWRPPDPCPPAIVAHAEGGGRIVAHNAGFERLLWALVLAPRYGWPPVAIEQFRCTAAQAAALSLPRDLGRLGTALGLADQKDTAGKNYIKKFSLPRKPRKDEL